MRRLGQRKESPCRVRAIAASAEQCLLACIHMQLCTSSLWHADTCSYKEAMTNKKVGYPLSRHAAYDQLRSVSTT
eukprot:9202313-Pyramimonas_sp.AAC.1